jgi:hypothetical protein
MAIASAQILRISAIYCPRKRRLAERFEMQESILDIAKIISELASRQNQSSPRQPQTANDYR